MIAPEMLVCSSFLISVCMFIVSKFLLISIATENVSAWTSIWLNPFATVLFYVCMSVLRHDVQHANGVVSPVKNIENVLQRLSNL